MGLIVKKATTTPIRVDISIPTDAGRMEGWFTGHAFVRSKEEGIAIAEARMEQIESAQAAFRRAKDADEPGADIALLRALAQIDEATIRGNFASFEGLGNAEGKLDGEDAFNEILHGQYSTQFTAAVIAAYGEKFKEAKRGN